MTSPSFRLSRKQITAIGKSTHALNVWYGSVSSGKTLAWLIMMLAEIKQAGQHGAIVIAGKTLDTVYQNIFYPLMTEPIFATAAPYIHYTRRNPTAKIFGREVMVIGVNDKGAEGRIRGGTFQLLFYDELTLCPQNVWEMLWSRMRATGNPKPPRVFATTNPATPAHYLKTDYIDKPVQTDTYAELFTMEDNPGLTREYIERMYASYSGLFYRRMIQGEWVSAEGAVFESWNPDVMVTPRAEGTVLAVGIDYGTNHPTAGYALTVTDDGLQLSHEWSPQTNNMGGRTRLTDMELADSLEEWLAELPNQPKGIYLDPAAASFKEELYRRRLNVAAAKNKVVDGIRTLDSLFTNGVLTVAEDCPRLINEIPGYRWDPKATENGKDAPIKEEDDHCFTADTLVPTTRGLLHIVDVRPGDLALTRDGFRMVTACGMTKPEADTITIEYGGRKLSGTANHPMWVVGQGWTPLGDIEEGDELLQWNETLSPIEGLSSTATQTPTGARTASTTAQGLATGNEEWSTCTEKSGKMPTVLTPSQTGITSTIKTAIPSTMTQAISHCYRTGSTNNTTCVNAGAMTSGELSVNSTSPALTLKRLSGTAQKPGLNGTVNTVNSHGSIGNTGRKNATTAVGTSKLVTVDSGTETSSAQTSARARGDEQLALMMNNAPANYAELSSLSASTAKPAVAPVRVQRVYAGKNEPVFNLTVDGNHEFIANGLVVHNCDAARYAVFSSRQFWVRHVEAMRDRTSAGPIM